MKSEKRLGRSSIVGVALKSVILSVYDPGSKAVAACIIASAPFSSCPNTSSARQGGHETGSIFHPHPCQRPKSDLTVAQTWRSGRGRPETAPPPLDADRLERLALRYVERYATTRAKLLAYLNRKVRERGFVEDQTPEISGLVERIATLGYVDDQAFANMRSTALSRRGYGPRRVAAALRQAGISEGDSADAQERVKEQAWEAALRFAERRKIGPFAAERSERPAREKALAAMLRAGHGLALSRAMVNAAPGVIPEWDNG